MSDPWLAYPPQAQPPAKQRPRRWIIVTVAVWCLLLVGGVGWAVATGEPTAREQSTVAEALPVVDRATVELVRAISADGQAVAAISALRRAPDCEVTVVRSGQRYTRMVTAFVTPDTELALLRRVGERLPRDYRTYIRTGAAPRLNADAGLFVLINATVLSPGVVGFVVDTGDCRVPGDLPDSVTATSTDSTNPDATPRPEPGLEPGPRALADQTLGWLRVPAARAAAVQAECPDGGSITTVELVGEKGIAVESLDVQLAVTSGQIAVSTPDLFAYSVGTVGVSARVVDDTVVITATSAC